jgi:hypothetical protein
MLTREQKERTEREAYLPEHLPDYVCAISGAEPFCFGDYLAYAGEEVLIFIGYPLNALSPSGDLEGKLAEAVRACKRGLVSLIAPAIPPSLGSALPPSDHYHRLDLTAVVLSQKTRNMLRRARRELTVHTDQRFGPEHGRIVEGFLAGRTLGNGTRSILAGIDRYLAASPGARILEARNGAGVLVAFDVAEFTPRDYVFYMFNFTDAGLRIPGASDLLLSSIIEQAVTEGKRYINLGLGVNAGVAAFKRKWGGTPFLPYAFHRYHPGGRGLLEMLFESMVKGC